MHRITGIDPGSVLEHLDVRVGDMLHTIDGEPVLDIVDYEDLSTRELITLGLVREGTPIERVVEKELYAPLGLSFEGGLMGPLRSCKNHCKFCFIDQMPKGGRETLTVKDDDWRMSFFMGNYITLTNVDDAEFARILHRRVSPLYISVHATDPALRIALMRNPTAGRLMERLTALKEAGLTFHAQVVCCPGLNDGDALNRTMQALSALYPAAASMAVVPVGLTKFREKLSPLRPFTKAEAGETIDRIEGFARGFAKKNGTAFVFAADEFYILAERPLPPYGAYEDFLQIENGVGLLRQFEGSFLSALAERGPLKTPRWLSAAGGTAAAPFFRELYAKLNAYNVALTLYPIANDYFGHTIHVGGLVTGGDLLKQLKGRLETDELLIPHNMLREREDVFLDGMRVFELSAALDVTVTPVRGEGEAWVRAIFDRTRTAHGGRRFVRTRCAVKEDCEV